MKWHKILRWAVILFTVTTLLTSIVPAHHVYAATAPPPTASDSVKCDKGGGGPLDWVLCPTFNLISTIVHTIIVQYIVPFLKVPPINTTDSSSGIFIAWSNFRIYGDIFLVIAIIVVVLGQAIGGGIIDAYTAKKVLPRILIAAILINLSIYIVAFLVDIFNILGNGIQDLILAPFQNTLNFTPTAAQGLGIFSVGLLGAILSVGGLASIVIAMVTSGGAVFAAALFAVLPIIFAMIAVFVTLIFRQGLILLLLMISPVAFALYALPNTERIFKKWWDLLIEALMVYPIIMMVFATADVLSGTLMQANGVTAGGASGAAGVATWAAANPATSMVAFALQFAPLFVIPFAFKIAGGTLSKALDLGKTGLGGVTKAFDNHKKQADLKFGNLKARGQQNAYRRLKGIQGDQSRNRATRIAAGFASGRMGGYNIEGKVAEEQARMNKEIGDITSAGPDEEVRALTVNKNLLNEAKRGGVAGLRNSNQFVENEDWRIGSDGEIQLADAAGKFQGLAHADAADKRWGNNNQALQAALAYTMTKVSTQEENDHMVQTYGALAASRGLTDDEAAGAWIGAAFSNQNTNMQFKHYGWQGASGGAPPGLRMNGQALMQEVDEKKGSWQMSQQNADTWTTMRGEVERAQQQIARNEHANPNTMTPQQIDAMKAATRQANDTLLRARRIADSYQASGQGAIAVGGDNGDQPISATGGPARVQQETRAFINAVNQTIPEGHNREEYREESNPRYRRGGP